MIHALMMMLSVSAYAQQGQVQKPGNVSAASAVQMAAQPAPVAPTGDNPIDSILTEEMIRSLRDPFQMPTILLSKKEKPKTDLELFQITDFKLNGVITGPKKTKAMITAPNGKTYFIAVGDRIGIRDGKVTAIQADAIKVVEYDVDEKGQRHPEMFEVRITGEVQSLSKKEE